MLFISRAGSEKISPRRTPKFLRLPATAGYLVTSLPVGNTALATPTGSPSIAHRITRYRGGVSPAKRRNPAKFGIQGVSRHLFLPTRLRVGETRRAKAARSGEFDTAQRQRRSCSNDSTRLYATTNAWRKKAGSISTYVYYVGALTQRTFSFY